MSASAERSYGRGAAVLSVGIGVTGVVTFGYFALASHSLPESQYGHITLLWSAVFITVSVLYRPVEQLLSRTIADRDARGVAGNEHLRVAATIQLALGVLFVVVALALRGPIEDELLGGSSSLYTILIVAVLAYAASYFARGFLAGHRRFGLYGGLVLLEATSRFMFALAVAVGIAEGQTAVALRHRRRADRLAGDRAVGAPPASAGRARRRHRRARRCRPRRALGEGRRPVHARPRQRLRRSPCC